MSDTPASDDLTPVLARIKSTFLGTEDHGIFTASLQLDYGDAAQAAGQYDLRHSDAAFHFVAGVCRVLGVDRWEKVVGRDVYALVDNGGRGAVRGLRSLPFVGKAEFLFASMYEDGDQ